MKEESTRSLLLKLVFHICIFIGTIIAFLFITSSLLNMTVLELIITEFLILLSFWPIGLTCLFFIGCAYFVKVSWDLKEQKSSELGEKTK